jgi:hypothetical protein
MLLQQEKTISLQKTAVSPPSRSEQTGSLRFKMSPTAYRDFSGSKKISASSGGYPQPPNEAEQK